MLSLRSISAGKVPLLCSTQAILKEETLRRRANAHSRFLISLAPPFVAAALTLSSFWSPPESLAQLGEGASLFNKACIGCHAGGGNIIQPGATLFMKDLQRNGFDTEETIYGITYYGKGRMPGFGQKCTPRGQCTFGPRLSDEEIKLLARLVKLEAHEGWPDIES